MNKTRVAALGVLVVAIAFVIWLAHSSRQPPVLPADETHARWESATACETCHGPEGPVPKPPTHPLGFDCLRCHGQAP